MTDRAKRKSAHRRGPRKATPDYLRNSALYYLECYESSAAHLRRLLLAKVERSARFHGTESSEGTACVEGLIAEFLEHGLLDDARYAEGRALVLHRRGNSARAIRAGLALKGIDAEPIEQALGKLAAQAADPELAAALAYARRRRLGPYRSPETRPAARERDLASLGRRGFTYDLARRVIETRDMRELEEEAGLA